MRTRHFYATILASSLGSAATGYLFGNNAKLINLSDYSPNWLLSFKQIEAASGGGGEASLSAIPTRPVELKPHVTEVRVEDLEIWKKPSRAAEIMRFGYPGFDNLKTYEDFIVSYDRRNRTAHWVMEHLSPDQMAYNPDVERSKSLFKPDQTIHPYFQSQNEDYRGSGYDRGHLAAAANHRRTQLAMDQTFLLSNMSPQVGKGFNRDKWNDLEKYVRGLGRKNLNVYICSGPLYLPHQEAGGNFYVKYKVIGNSRVAVPTHFFKVVLIESSKDQFELEAYLLPNESIPDDKPLSCFLTPLDAIERAAGFLLFENLPKSLMKKVNGKKLAEVDT